MESNDISIEMLLIMLVWLSLLVVTSRNTIYSSNSSVGIPMSFLLSMTFFYIGAFTYAIPGYTHFVSGNLYLLSYDFTEQTVLSGAFAVLIAVAGFTCGCMLVQKKYKDKKPSSGFNFEGIYPKYIKSLFVFLGGICVLGFILNAFPPMFPMQQVFAQVGRNMAIPVICLGAIIGVQKKGISKGGMLSYKKWVALAISIPVIYLVVWGFVSYGFIVFTIFAGFWLAVLSKHRRRLSIRVGLYALVITYILLSFFVAYMSFRSELREVIWGGGGYTASFVAIFDAFSNTKLLNPFDFESLDWLNIRLNQYIFVGKAIEYHQINPDLRLNGSTLFLALFSWVPRVLWPGKPEMGSNELVEAHTGMVFSERAVFATGPVMEFYINFGYIGIFLGFVLLGYLVRQLDKRAALALKEGRLVDFIRLFTVGIAIVAPLTDLFFVVSTAVATWLTIWGIKPVTHSLFRRFNQ